MQKSQKIFIAGHRGMVGSAIYRSLLSQGYDHFVLPNSQELDLKNQESVMDFFSKEKPEYVFLAAAKVGGIWANNVYRADFLYENLIMEANVIHAAFRFGVKKLLFLGSSCIYPKFATQPLKEEYLLSGVLEPTNEPYAIAKIAGIKLCEAYWDQYGCAFISVMPTNLYGTGDNYHPENSHVIPALIRKFHEAKKSNTSEVTIWGTGSPLREFLHADDLAEACVFVMNQYEKKEFLNIGSSTEISILELATLIKKVVGYDGELVFDTSKPDGTPRKLMDSGKIRKMGWVPKIMLEEGLKKTYHEAIPILDK
jgi:GDP-L-fucose synthase